MKMRELNISEKTSQSIYKSKVLLNQLLIIIVILSVSCKKNSLTTEPISKTKIVYDSNQKVYKEPIKDLDYYRSHIISDTLFDPKFNISTLFPSDSGVLTGKGSLKAIHLIKPYLIMDTFVQLNEVKIKYFRNKDHSITGCFYDYSSFESLFFTIKQCKKFITTIFNTISHGNYNCCTNEYFNLSHHENFYTIENCATGSGYCEKDLWFFNDIKKIDYKKSIVLQIDSWNETGKISLTSEYKISNDTIFVNYKDVIKKNKYKEYNLSFVYKNGNIVLLDSLDDITFARMIGVFKDF